MGHDLIKLSTENESLEIFQGEWLVYNEESKAKPLRQFNDEKRSNLIMTSLEKQMKK